MVNKKEKIITSNYIDYELDVRNVYRHLTQLFEKQINNPQFLSFFRYWKHECKIWIWSKCFVVRMYEKKSVVYCVKKSKIFLPSVESNYLLFSNVFACYWSKCRCALSIMDLTVSKNWTSIALHLLFWLLNLNRIFFLCIEPIAKFFWLIEEVLNMLWAFP